MTMGELRRLLSVMPSVLDSYRVVFEEEGEPRDIDHIAVTAIGDAEKWERLVFIGGTTVKPAEGEDVRIYALGMRR